MVLQHLCAIPDLETKRNIPLDLPAPIDALSALMANVPPMFGGEYISIEILVSTWQDLVTHIQHCILNFHGSVSEYLHELNPAWNLLGRV